VIIDNLTGIKSSSMFYKFKDFIRAPLYLKLEGLNIAKSIKLKTAQYMLEVHEEAGHVIKGKSKIICSSSGNLAIALAILCKEKKYPLTCVVDPNTNALAKKFVTLYGGEIIEVTERDKNGGYLQSRINLINKMLLHDSNLFWINQYDDPENYYAHYHITAKEILQEIQDVSHLFVGSGTTGTLMGCAKYFKEHSPHTKIIGVDSVGSVTFLNNPKKRYIPGLGTSIAPSILDKSYIDEVLWVEEIDTIWMCHKLLKKYGLFVGGSTGTVLYAIYKNYKNYKAKNMVAISPDFGDTYVDTVYNPEWIKSKYNKNLEEILHGC
jgi:cysteine synthase A